MRTLRAACLLMLLVAGPSVFASDGQGPEPLLWPRAPAQARIEFVRTFSQAGDLGIGKGLLEKLKDLLFGAAEEKMVRPMAVVASGGIIYVADTGAGCVHRFDTRAGDYARIGAEDGKSLPSPVGLAQGANGEVYVADSVRAQVMVIRPGARTASPLSLGISLRQPTGLAFDPAGKRLYVADTADHVIHVFAADGALAGSIGKRGTGEGEFNFPTYLWRTSGGELYVTDSLNFRIQRFDAAGNFVGTFGRQGDGLGETARPKGIASDPYGHVYLVDALLHAFQIFDESGRFLLPVGERGQERGEFWLPTGIFVDGDLIYVADTYNRRIQVFRYIGGAT